MFTDHVNIILSQIIYVTAKLWRRCMSWIAHMNIFHTVGDSRWVSRVLIISIRQAAARPSNHRNAWFAISHTHRLTICHHGAFAPTISQNANFRSAPCNCLVSLPSPQQTTLIQMPDVFRRCSKEQEQHILLIHCERVCGRRWNQASIRCVQCPPRKQNLEHEAHSVCRRKICLAGDCCSFPPFMVRHKRSK